MREKMLTDTFVLDNIAILGQATVIYAKPNTGKTLIVMKMLIESIKAGRVKGDDVYYINADDTYKGLVTKLEINAGFKTHNHIQLCIINPDCIKGIFLPREKQVKN